MFRSLKPYSAALLLLVLSHIACKNKNTLKTGELVLNPTQMNEQVRINIENVITIATSNNSILQDSIVFNYYNPVKYYYNLYNFTPLWCSKEKWLPNATLLLQYIENAALQGLYKEDYYVQKMYNLKNILDTDSIKKMDPVLWAEADVMMSNVFAALLTDLKQGRLQVDSLSWKNDTAKFRNFYTINFQKIKEGENLNNILENLQPKHSGYIAIKKVIKNFIDSMDNKKYTYLPFPITDSAKFIKLFTKRINEEGITIKLNADSLELKIAVKKYEKLKGLTIDGKIGTTVIKELNLTDKQKFYIIAITLDRYKSLPEAMPQKYIWVNLPSYNLKVWDGDSLRLESKIICGKPATPTPNITSAISNIILYPTWTVPTSIISKDMLPGLKRNTDYLSRRGLYLLNSKGERVNETDINWAKYKKGIPYTVQQASGDGNALGIIKFNFENPFSVYLHDTNQRYLFKNSNRSLSHGCVRVQEWQKLANFIIRNDSLNEKKINKINYNTDSLTTWMAQKQKRNIDIKNKMPLFIRYFSCEAVNGVIKFYDDIYGEDKVLKERFFASK